MHRDQTVANAATFRLTRRPRAVDASLTDEVPVRRCPVRAVWYVALVLVTVAALGCTGAGNERTAAPAGVASAMPDPATTPAAVASPAPTASSAPQSQPDPRITEAIDAYLEYWDVFLAANDPPDETYPALRRVATGAAYEALFDAAQANRLGGRVLRLPEDSVSRHNAEVVSITDDRAVVRDCNVDDGLVVDADSGEVLDDDVITRLGTATLVRDDGRWKVSRTRVRKTWEGVAECAAS